MSSLRYDTIVAMNTNKFAYNKYVAEILGTLLLVLVAVTAPVLLGSGFLGIIVSSVALIFIVYLFGNVSGAHVNPALTISALTMKKISWQDAVLYVCSQLIGAGIALMIIKNIPSFPFADLASKGLSTGSLFAGEFVGTMIFAMAFSAVINGKTEKGTNGFVIGFGLLFGLLFANIISGGVGSLNPAVALGSNLMNWVLFVAPILGAIVGAWAYKIVAFGSICGCDSLCDDSCGCGFCHKKAKAVHSHTHEHAHSTESAE